MFILQTFCYAAPQPPPRYQWLESNEDRGVFFDTQTIKFTKTWDGKPDTQVIDVWLYTACNNGEVQETIKFRTSRKLNITGWENLSYYLDHYQFNFKTNRVIQVAYVYYDAQGNILESNTYTRTNWEDIIPGSVGEFWITELRKFVSSNWNFVLNRSY